MEFVWAQEEVAEVAMAGARMVCGGHYEGQRVDGEATGAAVGVEETVGLAGTHSPPVHSS